MKNTYCDVIEFFGADAQKVKALEELSELQVELVRDLNGSGNIDAIIEETADVMNMMEQICIIYDIGDLVEQMKAIKMNRVMERIRSKKTILQDFKEKHPNYMGDCNGLPKVCANNLGYPEFNECSDDDTCERCWNRPLEEVF